MEEALPTPPRYALPLHPRLHRLRMDVVSHNRYALALICPLARLLKHLTTLSPRSHPANQHIYTGRDQTILQSLLLPICTLPILLPTPLLEPRYFLIPYILMRAQVVDVPVWGLVLEGAWYAAVNAVTMWVFLYKERAGVGRFMW